MSDGGVNGLRLRNVASFVNGCRLIGVDCVSGVGGLARRSMTTLSSRRVLFRPWAIWFTGVDGGVTGARIRLGVEKNVVVEKGSGDRPLPGRWRFTGRSAKVALCRCTEMGFGEAVS